MLDFLKIVDNKLNNGKVIEIIPSFDTSRRSKDIMTKGGEFYAIWDEDNHIWCTDFNDAIRLIDNELRAHYEANKEKYEDYKVDSRNSYYKPEIRIGYVGTISAKNKNIDILNKFYKEYKYDYKPLDCKLTFLSDVTTREDYVSKRLPYDVKNGSCEAYNEIMSTLYSPEERRKLEWAIGSILAGDSVKIQKFLVLYGKGGTGKSTVLNIIQKLFDGYWAPFKASDLGNASKDFSMEAFKTNPLVSIEHDGDLSRIDDNTKLNSIVSHENMLVNEKFKSLYKMKCNSMLFLASNKPVKITDGRSGLLRRLIDVYPTGKLIDADRYDILIDQIDFEIPAIAYHCMKVYKRCGKDYYAKYQPERMKDITDHFYDFILEHYSEYKKDNSVTLASAWSSYKLYCEASNVTFPYPKSKFKQEMLVYFKEFKTDYYDATEGHLHNKFIDFTFDLNEKPKQLEEIDISEEETQKNINTWIDFKSQKSKFDILMSDCPAQLASKNETPTQKWSEVETKLNDISTKELHYVKVPKEHIVIDFDLKDENGEKSYEKNLEAASKWPKTYAELSKSGSGIHLHYIYDGDVSQLSRIYAPEIEVKVFTGNSSLRRKLTKCNNLDISTISSGLPLKETKGDKMVNFDTVKTEKSLRSLIARNLRKEIHAGTKPSIDFIYKILEDAYNNGLVYDVSDMRSAIFQFAANSTHQSDYCMNLVSKMKFKSEDRGEHSDGEDESIIFYDVEVFPNLFLVNWKKQGEENQVVRMINPRPIDIEELMKHRLVGFNCRRYDNHIMWARFMGYSNEELFNLSKAIVSGNGNPFFGEAWNLSYTDVYDFAAKKQSLKKWEIELGIKHHELGLPWDQPVPEELWLKVAEYCDDDVIATEAVFNHLKGDFTARQILADLAGGTVNDTTNSLTTKIVFGKEKKPKLVYTDLATGEQY